MPIHEYLCQDCNQRFEALTSSAKADQVACPTCACATTRRLISVIAGVGGHSGDSYGAYTASSPSGGCCGGAGGCACGH